jgi:hypothetical protein
MKIALVVAVLLAAEPLVSSSATAEPRSAKESVCEEDQSSEVPTYSARFDPKAPGGAGFAEAKARALRYCESKPCTVGGQGKHRTAEVYALGQMRSRFIAGFSCVAEAEGEAPSGDGLVYPLAEPSEIDRALVDATTKCAPRKAALADLAQGAAGLRAVFVCGS